MTSFDGDTDGNGKYWANNAMADGFWYLYWNWPHYCGPDYFINSPGGFVFHYGTPQPWLIQNKSTEVLPCEIYTSNAPHASTHFVDPASPPSSLDLSSMGEPLTTDSGMPQMYIYGVGQSSSGLLQTIDATSVSSDHLTATFPFPTGISGGLYGLALMNQNSDGPAYVDANYVAIASRQSFTTPFGVAAQTDSYRSWGYDIGDPYGDQTCAGGTYSWDTTTNNDFPVVSQYSAGTLSNNGSLIAVGANPSAVVLYDLNTNVRSDSSGPCHYSEEDDTFYQRALVANSGDSTLSVVDLSANSVVGTVYVGANPIGLAVSSDGSTAYSANAGAGSVTRVDLNSISVTGTASIGAPVSSLDLAPDGSIWAGGPSGLYHIDPSSMQVLGTYPTNGASIMSLKYGAAGSELVLTTAASDGSVAVTEVNPGNTISANAISVTASARVSTYSPSGGGSIAQARIATSNGLPMQLAMGELTGMTVNDGWLAISATPTGFVVTDTVNHVQLMQGTTPGVVTSIAIDPQEQVAYFAVPDAGVVMSVNLPSQ